MTSRYVSADALLTGASPVVVYTCPAATTTTVTHAVSVNTGADPLLLRVWLVRSGDTTSINDVIEFDSPINGEESVFICHLPNAVLRPGDFIEMDLDQTGTVNIFLSLLELT